MSTNSPSDPTKAHTPPPNSEDVEANVSAAIRRAEQWLEVEETSKSTKQLADMVHDPDGVEFTFAFVDRVARPEDNKVAAREFMKIAHPIKRTAPVPGFMSFLDTVLVTAGAGGVGLLLTQLAVAAGAHVHDWQGKTLDYTPRESFLNPGFRVSIY